MTREKLEFLAEKCFKACNAIQELQETFSGLDKEDDENYNFPIREIEEIERAFQNISSKYYEFEVELEKL